MADQVELSFLSERIKRLQGDVRTLKSDVAQLRADQAKVEGEIASLDAKVTRLENNIEAFQETVSDRFDQQTELIKSSFRALVSEIQSLKKA